MLRRFHYSGPARGTGGEARRAVNKVDPAAFIIAPYLGAAVFPRAGSEVQLYITAVRLLQAPPSPLLLYFKYEYIYRTPSPPPKEIFEEGKGFQRVLCTRYLVPSSGASLVTVKPGNFRIAAVAAQSLHLEQ